MLLSKPAAVEQVVVGNLEQCKAFRKGGELSAWEGYLRGLPSILKKGDCTTPLAATYFNYLDITTGWQQPIHICKGNKAHIFATTSDKFRITESGPWITVAGDPAGGATDPQYPCHGDPQCLAGMLMGRFVTDDGVEVIFVVGADTVFTAPENGTLSVGINALISPAIGAISDRAGRRLPYLLFFTLLAIVPAIFIPSVPVGLGVVLFCAANFGYQIGRAHV